MLPRLLDLLFPPRCLYCRTPLASAHEALCNGCAAAIPLEKTLRCGECLARIPEKRRICHNNFPYTLGTAAHYKNPSVRTLVQGLKFRHAHAAAFSLGTLLAKYLRSLP